jgi:hypothetical protein
MVQFYKHDMQPKVVKGVIVCFVLCHELYVRVDHMVYKREIPCISGSFIVPAHSLIAVVHVS